MSRLFVQVGFPWAVRTLAFFNFALQLVAIPLTKERLPKNMKLPLVDLDTFKEPLFVVYSIGGFLSAFGMSSREFLHIFADPEFSQAYLPRIGTSSFIRFPSRWIRHSPSTQFP